MFYKPLVQREMVNLFFQVGYFSVSMNRHQWTSPDPDKLHNWLPFLLGNLPFMYLEKL